MYGVHDRVGTITRLEGGALVVALFYVNGGISRRAALGCIALYFPTYVV